MLVTIDSRDTRTVKAIELAASAGQWLKCRAVDGRKAYGIASQRARGVYHLTTCQACTCYDFQRRQQACKHVLAVRLHVALATAVAASGARPARARRRRQDDAPVRGVDGRAGRRLTRGASPQSADAA